MAIDGHQYRTVLQFMHLVSSHEGFESEAEWASAFIANTKLTVAVNQHGPGLWAVQGVQAEVHGGGHPPEHKVSEARPS